MIGPSVEAASKSLPDAGVLLVENGRFFSEEEANADSFAQALAKLGDVYVNDAFGAAHRAHASTAGVAKYLPQAAMGLLMERELQYLKDELANPDRPFLVILGGSKVSDKIAVVGSSRLCSQFATVNKKRSGWATYVRHTRGPSQKA